MAGQMRVAIVEDEEQARDKLAVFLGQYGERIGVEFLTSEYPSATLFLDAFKGNFDIILMDIELSDGNGMDVSFKVRKTDKNVIIIFVTNMAQYAVKGYEVDALDFVVKPVSYVNFSMKMDRAMERYRQSRGRDIWIKENGEQRRLRTSEIKYIEVEHHNLIYHTTEGNFRSYDQLKRVCDLLKDEPFTLCNRCYLVNLRYVTAVKHLTCTVAEEELQVSRNKRQEFLKRLNDFLGGGV